MILIPFKRELQAQRSRLQLHETVQGEPGDHRWNPIRWHRGHPDVLQGWRLPRRSIPGTESDQRALIPDRLFDGRQDRDAAQRTAAGLCQFAGPMSSGGGEAIAENVRPEDIALAQADRRVLIRVDAARTATGVRGQFRYVSDVTATTRRSVCCPLLSCFRSKCGAVSWFLRRPICFCSTLFLRALLCIYYVCISVSSPLGGSTPPCGGVMCEAGRRRVLSTNRNLSSRYI